MVTEGAPGPHGDLFWEMGDQLAVRRGAWKLVLRGKLVEGAPPEDDVHLSDLSADMGERENLAAANAALVEELTAAATEWHDGIESRWQSHWLPRMQPTTPKK
jgi:arylsulfatase A-like enzyme